jgi:hypothetical protein
MKYIKFSIVFGIIFLVVSFFSINYTNAQSADGACSAGATSLEQNCTFQNGSSRLNGKCQVKDKNNPGLGLTCRTSLGSSCSGDTCQNGLACINQVCSSPRGAKTQGQSCSGNGNECIAGLECRNFICTKEAAITGGGSGQTGGGQVGTPGGSTGAETGLVKCGVSRDCTICDIFILIRDIFNFALGLLASLAVLSVVIGGVYVLTSAGNPGAVSTGYGIITNAVIGLLLVMASFLLFSFLLVGLGFQEQNFSAVLTFQPGKVFEVKCDNASTFNDNGSNGGGSAVLGNGGSNSSTISCASLNDSVKADLNNASSQTGVPSELLAGIMQRECPAAFNNANACPNENGSGAAGAGQFLQSSWNELGCSGSRTNRRDALVCMGKHLKRYNKCSSQCNGYSNFSSRACSDCVAGDYCGACSGSSACGGNYCDGVWSNYQKFKTCK